MHILDFFPKIMSNIPIHIYVTRNAIKISHKIQYIVSLHAVTNSLLQKSSWADESDEGKLTFLPLLKIKSLS